MLLLSLLSVKNSEYLQQAALEEYGPDLHMALRSRRDELLYLRKLTEMLFPYILPPKATDCRWASYGPIGLSAYLSLHSTPLSSLSRVVCYQSVQNLIEICLY